MDVQPFSHFLDALRAWSEEAPRRAGQLTETAMEDELPEDDFEPLEDVHLGADGARDERDDAPGVT